MHIVNLTAKVLFPTVFAIALMAAPAHAGSMTIYRFVDSDGFVHYTNMPVDARYQPRVVARASPKAKRPPAKQMSVRPRFQDLVAEAAVAHGVEKALLNAIITVESGFNSRSVSPKGAMGLMQLMPATAQRYGARDPFDPRQNLFAGAKYLSDLLTMFDNDLRLTLAAYNAGENAVLRFGRAVPPYRETQRYVPAVLRHLKSYRRAAA